MKNLVGQEIGNYKLLDLLGQGSSAHVYLGEHKYLRSLVGLKIVVTQAEWKKREGNEVSMLSHVTHPHIVSIQEYGIQDDVQFLVMDWAKQGTLLDLFTKSLPISIVAIYVKQLADALQHLHTMHIIHRDIKPMNILVDSSGNLLLADFELAVDYRNCQSTAGTPTYAAPEQKQGRPCPASDQYALGVLVYQWLCGELPVYRSSAKLKTHSGLDGGRYRQSNAFPSPLRDKVPTLPSAVVEVVLTALAEDPNSRFANIQMFAEVFEQACQSSGYRTPVVPKFFLAHPTKI